MKISRYGEAEGGEFKLEANESFFPLLSPHKTSRISRNF